MGVRKMGFIGSKGRMAIDRASDSPKPRKEDQRSKILLIHEPVPEFHTWNNVPRVYNNTRVDNT